MTFLRAALLANRLGAVFAAVFALVAPLALAQDEGSPTSADDVRAEISETMAAIAAYSEQERDRAMSEAREVLNRLDGEIERREQALREDWTHSGTVTF